MNEEYLKQCDSNKKIDIVISNVTSVEMDEMWSYYHDKKHQIWLWWAVDHETNTPLAYVFGTREYKYLDELLELLKPFNIGTVYADNNFAYESRVTDKILVSGKKNTQNIERDHLTLRTRIKRLARKTICFSKDPDIHKSVIGTFINIFFFGRDFDYSTVLRHPRWYHHTLFAAVMYNKFLLQFHRNVSFPFVLKHNSLPNGRQPKPPAVCLS